MIYVSVSDGLGNQFFQYALAKSVQLKFKTEVKLDHLSKYRDIYSYKSFFRDYRDLPFIGRFERGYLLDKFNITLPESNIKELQRLYNGKKIFANLIFKRPLKRNNKVVIEDTTSEELYESTMKQIEEGKQAKDKDIYLIGWWQVKIFAEDAMDFLKEELTLREENKSSYFYRMQTLIQESESVAIHIRQKLDYEASFYNDIKHKSNLDYSYYLAAIEFIQRKINRNLKLFIFADDVELAKKYPFPEDLDCVLVSGREGLKEYEDMALMSLCKHSIISNSTFSLWGAWLNSNPNKILIAPSKDKWSSDKDKGTDLLLGKDWIRL